MDITEITGLFVNSGTAIAVIVYFMYRDIKFMTNLQKVLETLVATTDSLKDIVVASHVKKETEI